MLRNTLLVAIASSAISQTALAEETLVKVSEKTESIRLRGGFSFNGGGGFGVADGGTASFGARLGLQFNRWFSTYYQALPMAFLAGGENGLVAGAIFANSLLVNATLGDFFDVGVGPSLDYSAIAGCNAGLNCDAAKGVEFGLHGRLAINLGGRDRDTGRRSGFSIGIDMHPIFTPAGTLMLATAGLGGEWF